MPNRTQVFHQLADCPIQLRRQISNRPLSRCRSHLVSPTISCLHHRFSFVLLAPPLFLLVSPPISCSHHCSSSVLLVCPSISLLNHGSLSPLLGERGRSLLLVHDGLSEKFRSIGVLLRCTYEAK